MIDVVKLLSDKAASKAEDEARAQVFEESKTKEIKMIKSLYEQGVSVEIIANATNKNTKEVEEILNN